jgi:hypothetical protein
MNNTVRLFSCREFKLCFSSSHQITCFKARKDFTPLPRTALLALLRCEFWAVFTRLSSAVRVATLYDISVTLKHAIWWLLLWYHSIPSVDTIRSWTIQWTYSLNESSHTFSPRSDLILYLNLSASVPWSDLRSVRLIRASAHILQPTWPDHLLFCP